MTFYPNGSEIIILSHTEPHFVHNKDYLGGFFCKIRTIKLTAKLLLDLSFQNFQAKVVAFKFDTLPRITLAIV